jgi:hypothetical protein
MKLIHIQTDFSAEFSFLCFPSLIMLIRVEYTPLIISQALELDYEIEKSEMDLELLQIQSTSMQRYQTSTLQIFLLI